MTPFDPHLLVEDRTERTRQPSSDTPIAPPAAIPIAIIGRAVARSCSQKRATFQAAASSARVWRRSLPTVERSLWAQNSARVPGRV